LTLIIGSKSGMCGLQISIDIDVVRDIIRKTDESQSI